MKSAGALTILELQGTFSAIEQKYGDMKIRVNGTEVTVDGNSTDIASAFEEINNECNKIVSVTYKHLRSKEWLNFSRKEEIVKYIKTKLQQKHLLGSWEIHDTDVSVFVLDKSSGENIKNTLLESILEEYVPVDRSSIAFLKSEWWDDFLFNIGRQYEENLCIVTKEEQDIVIIGTDDVVPHVKNMVQIVLDLDSKTMAISCQPVECEFISEYWTRDNSEDVYIKTNEIGFEFRGRSDNLIKSIQKLEKKLKDMCSKKHVIKRTGTVTVLEAAKHSSTIRAIEKECTCIIKLPQETKGSLSVNPSDYDVIDLEIVEEKQQDSSTGASPKCFQTRRHKIKIQLIQGEIRHQKADIIVVGAASNLDLQNGSAFYSSLKQGGPKLQKDYNRLYPNGIQDGEVAVIDSGDFCCDKIYLTSLPPWKESICYDGKVFRNFMRECLRLADKYEKETIAFSTMGTDRYLGYPVDVVVNIMYGTAVEFDKSYSTTSLKEIKIVMYKEDHKTFEAFERHEHMRIYGASSVGSLSTDFVGGRFRIELVTEDLSTQRVDAILCSLSDDMDLNRSVICKSLVLKGGKSVQDEFEKICCKKRLDAGTVEEIPGGNLSCKTLFFTVLSKYTENNSDSAEQNLITTLQAVFKLANSKGYKSFAIPVLETGYLNYPEKIEAKSMYDAAIDCAIKTENASLKSVRFVMYSKDTVSQQIYRMCHLKTQGREARRNRTFIQDGTILINPDEDSKYRMVKDGCAIGPIQLQVQVGELLNNTADATVVVVGDSCDTKGDILKSIFKFSVEISVIRAGVVSGTYQENCLDEVVITGSTRLHPQYLYPLQFQDSLTGWRDKIVDRLEYAGKKSIQSVAFPLPGSGTTPKTFPTDSIAGCLFAAIHDFTSTNPKSSVTDVRLVINDCNKECKPAIIAAMQAKITAVNSQKGIGKIFKSQLGFVTGSIQFKDSTVTVHSDATINIDRCIKVLDDRMGLEFTKQVIDADMDVIRNLNNKQIKSMIDSDLLVDVIFDKQTGKFTVAGPLGNVLAAVTCLQNKMRQYKEKANSCSSPKNVYYQTKWHWLCENRVASEAEVAYDMMTNIIIETAYREGKENVELQSKDGKIYVIDFQKLVEYPKINVYDTVMVIRKDILKDQMLASFDSHEEETWTTRSNIERFALTKKCLKYKKVETNFLEGFMNGVCAGKVKNNQSVQVVKIEQIRNGTLYRQFKAKESQMLSQNRGMKMRMLDTYMFMFPNKNARHMLKRKLWHEASEKSMLWIINNGFNRSYCGVQEISNGQGVYFAADVSYYAKSFRAGKPRTKRYMFLAKVLTGKLIKGTPSMRAFPHVNPDCSEVMFNCAVDNMDNPMEYVIFHDNQAYPKYLITYISE